MKTKAIINRILWVFAALLLSLLCVFESTLSINAKAETVGVVDFSKTDIMDDLSDVDVLQYPKNELGKMEVIRFQEYCYSDKLFFAEYYGLYLYLYNPTETPIKTETGANRVNVATRIDGNGKPTYENVSLVYCSKTENNRFYKFKLETGNAFRKAVDTYAETHNGERRYDIAGIEVFRTDGTAAKDNVYAKTYIFSGYAEDMSYNSDKPLSVHVESLETLELDVEHTYYRTGDYINNVCDELNTVYFSVDDKYIEQYGGLQAIKAEWYEHMTTPIYVTSDSGAYEYLKNYINTEIYHDENCTGSDYGWGQSCGCTTNFDWRILWEEIDMSASSERTYWFYKRYGNYDKGSQQGTAPLIDLLCRYDWSEADVETRIDWLFLRENVKDKDDYRVSGEEIETYIADYMTSHPNVETFTVKGKTYPKALFSDSIDTDRVELLEESSANSGYICQEIYANEDKSLLVEEDKNWWEKLWTGVSYKDKGYAPIVTIDETDNIAALGVDGFAEKYLINDNDKQEVYNYCLSELAQDKTPVLFRFAQTDYYAANARFDDVTNKEMSDVDGYVAQMTTFLGFDVISLTFEKENSVGTVIPVVANPIDIINDVEPQPDIMQDDFDWLAELLAGIIGMLMVAGLAIVIMNFAPWLVKLVGDGIVWALKWLWWIVSFPFNLIGKLFKKKK